MAKAANVTKWDAGGSGDNIVADGYIKSVEKVWIDSYTFAAAIPSNTTIDIAKVPENAKVNSVTLYFPSLSTGASGTGTTINIGARIVAGTTANTLFLSGGEAASGVLTLSANAVDGINYVATGGVNTIYIEADRIATTTTAGTIKSIVRYT
jgi:hypothetical protein